MAQQLEDFDFEATCRSLGETAESAPAEARAAIELAAYALHFLYATDQFKAFREYLHEVKEPATREPHIEREFDDMAQATDWLNSPSSVPGAHVRVGGKTYEVWRDSNEKHRLMPFTSPQESKE